MRRLFVLLAVFGLALASLPIQPVEGQAFCGRCEVLTWKFLFRADQEFICKYHITFGGPEDCQVAGDGSWCYESGRCVWRTA